MCAVGWGWGWGGQHGSETEVETKIFFPFFLLFFK